MSGGCYEGLGFRSINNHWAGFPSKDVQVRLTSLCVLPRSFRLLCLDLLLNLRLLVDVVEVVHDDRDRQRDAENSTNRTNLEKKGGTVLFSSSYQLSKLNIGRREFDRIIVKTNNVIILLVFAITPWWSYRSYELPKPSDWIDVAVTHGGHRDNGPVERLERNDDFIELDYVKSFMNNNSEWIQTVFLHGIYQLVPKM